MNVEKSEILDLGVKLDISLKLGKYADLLREKTRILGIIIHQKMDETIRINYDNIHEKMVKVVNQ